MIEKLKRRSIWLEGHATDPAVTESAALLLRDVRGVLRVYIKTQGHLVVSYNVRRITLQTIEALLAEFDFPLRTSLFCRLIRGVCYYIEDIECIENKHDQADCTREAFIKRYLERPHGCRDQRPEYLRRYL